MNNTFGGLSEEEFFLGYDAMIDKDDPESSDYEDGDEGGDVDDDED